MDNLSQLRALEDEFGANIAIWCFLWSAQPMETQKEINWYQVQGLVLFNASVRTKIFNFCIIIYFNWRIIILQYLKSFKI